MSTPDPSQTSQLPTAGPVMADVDGFVVTSASAVAPHTEESLKQAMSSEGAEPGEPESDHPAATPPDLHRADAEPAIEPEEEAAEPAEEPAKPKKREPTSTERHREMLARIDAATRELRETERRTAELRAEQERLAKPKEEPKAEEEPLKRPRWKDYEDAGKSYQDYEEDLATFDEQREARREKASQEKDAAREQELRQQQQAEYVRTQAAAYESRVNDARQKHPDWDETIKTNLHDVPQTPFLVAMVQSHPKGAQIFYDLAKDKEVAKAWGAFDSDPATRPTQPIMSALYESADPTALLKHLAEHPDEYRRYVRMAPVSALLALGQLETRVVNGAKTGSPSRPISNAAAPLSHRAGAHARGTPPSLDDMDIEEFVRTENKREGRPSPI